MRTVLKWTVPVDDQWHPIGDGKVLHVTSQFGKRDEVQVWTEQELDQDQRVYIRKPRGALIIGTGHKVPEGAEHIGSVVPLSAGGHLVWHCYAEVHDA